MSVAVFAPALALAQAVDETGARIVDVIESLRQRGIVVIYSSELVTDTMRVREEPTMPDRIERLKAVLAPYDLALEPGPRDSWLVVRAPQTAVATDEEAEGDRSAPAGVGTAAMENVVVSASRYAISRADGPSNVLLEQSQLLDAPTLGEDAVRATLGLPGLTGNGLSARVNVRGGDTDEVLFLLDGVRLYNPYHLKDFQSLFSTVNPRIVDSMSVYTSAYPAEFGDRMSGVIDMRTVEPSERRLYEVGVSTLTTSVLSAGRFADGRASWLASARRGNLDLLINALDTDVGRPQYYDAFGKLSVDLSSALTVSGGMLVFNDKIALNGPNEADAVAQYEDDYAWVRTDYSTSKLDLELVFSRTESTTNRHGSVDDPFGATGWLDDRRTFASNSLDANATLSINDRNWVKGGIELGEFDAWYDFASERTDNVTIVTSGPSRTPTMVDETVNLDLRHQAAFLTYRAKPLEAVTTEIGMRWDQQSEPRGQQTSPRLNVLFELSPRGSLRASWGRYYQPQNADELQISDGITRLYGAEQAEHSVFGFQRLVGKSTSIRFEAYHKEFESLRPRHENLFARVSLLPELAADRVIVEPLSGKAYGLELGVQSETGPWLWSVNLARSHARDRLASGQAERSWEEPWSFKGNFRWAGPKWTVTGAATWHTGWPFTSLKLEDGQLRAGPFNANRFEAFATLDLRASRLVQLERGNFEWFVALNNALNRANPCCIDYEIEYDELDRPAMLNLSTGDWFGAVPSVGFVWRLSDDQS